MKKYLSILIYTFIYLNTNGQSLINKPIPNSNYFDYKKVYEFHYCDILYPYCYLTINTLAFDTSEFIINKRYNSEFYINTIDTISGQNALNKAYREIRVGFKKARLIADSISDTLAYLKKRKLEIPKEIASRRTKLNNLDLSTLFSLQLHIIKYTGNLNDFTDTNSVPQCDILAKQILDMASNTNISEVYIYSDHPFKYHFKGFKNLTQVKVEMENGFKIVDTSTLNKYADFINPEKSKKINCKDILELTSQNFYLDSLTPMSISFDSSFKQNKRNISVDLIVDGFKGLPTGFEFLNINNLGLYNFFLDSLPLNFKGEKLDFVGQVKYLSNIKNDNNFYKRFQINNSINIGSSQYYYSKAAKINFHLPFKDCWSNLPCLICAEFYKSKYENISEKEIYKLIINKNYPKLERATEVFSLCYPNRDSRDYEFELKIGNTYLANGNDMLLSKDSLLPLSSISDGIYTAVQNIIVLNFIDSISLAATKGKNLNNLSAIKSDKIGVYFYNSDVNYIIKNTPIEILQKIKYCYIDSYSLALLNYENAKKLDLIKIIEIPACFYKRHKYEYAFSDKEILNEYKPDKRVIKLFNSKTKLKALGDLKESIY